MLTKESLFVILYSLPVYQLLFYTVQLITLKRSNPSRRYLGIMHLAMTLFLVMNAMYHLGYEDQMRWMYYFFVPALLTIAPIYYLYLISLTRENHEVDSRTRFILFLPPLIILLLNLIVFRALSLAEKLTFLNFGFHVPTEIGEAYRQVTLVHWIGIAGLLLVQILMAVSGAYKILRKESEAMEKQPQHLAFLQIRWIVIISACVVVFLISSALLNLSGHATGMGPAVIYNGLMLICGGLSGYYGMKQDSLLMQVSKVKALPQELMAGDSDKGSEGAQNESLIDNEETQMILESLEKLMVEEKPYLNPKFSMHELCEKLNFSRRKVTYVINEVLNKNFYGVINDYRIEEAVKFLKDQKSEDYKMDAIAEMVGFQSKSSFYACFKKYTGVTPTEFRINLKKEAEH